MKKSIRERRTHFILIDNIIVDDGPRQIDEDAVRLLANSMSLFGMHTPIHVESAPRPDGMGANNIDEIFYHVISGRHRIVAAKQLGWDRIEALDFFDNPFFNAIQTAADENGQDPDYSIASRMWAIAENLKRAELTALQRSDQIAEWIELEKKWLASLKGVSAQLVEKPQGGRPEGGVSGASRELGINREDARRAVKVSSLSNEAKQAARETGLDNKRSVLLDAAKAKESGADDVVFLRQEHARREAEKARKEAERLNKDTDRVIALTEAEQFANWLMARVDLSELPTLISWLEGTKAKDVISALRRQAA